MVKEYDEIMTQELRETFEMFDKDKDGLLDLAEFRKAVRSSGVNPSEQDFKDMMELANIEKTVNFKQLLKVMQAEIRKMDREDDLLRALYVFDENNSGYIDCLVLKDCLKNMGEKLVEEELLTYTKIALPDMMKKIDYRKLVKELFKKPS